MACTPRIADCGRLMMGVDSREPNTPPLEIEKVPPVSSSMVSLPSWAFAEAGSSFSRSAKLF